MDYLIQITNVFLHLVYTIYLVIYHFGVPPSSVMRLCSLWLSDQIESIEHAIKAAVRVRNATSVL
jgi:hypothetical protein